MKMNMNLDKVCYISVMDKDGEELFRFDQIHDMNIKTSMDVGDPMITDVRFHAYGYNINEQEKKKEEFDFSGLDPLNSKYFIKVR